MSKVEFTSYGGSGGIVTGSHHQIRVDDEIFGLDCEMFQGSQDLEEHNNDNIPTIF